MLDILHCNAFISKDKNYLYLDKNLALVLWKVFLKKYERKQWEKVVDFKLLDENL